MIEPFAPRAGAHGRTGSKIVSYGTSSYGYDVRCAREFKIFTNINSTIVDPKTFDEKSFVDVDADVCIIPPNSFALARTVEYFRIPRTCSSICLGKTTYARCGIIVNVTPLEPEWEGHVTLEFSNTTPLPAKIYANEGVAQMLFFESDEVCETSYKRSRRQVPGTDGRHAAEDLRERWARGLSPTCVSQLRVALRMLSANSRLPFRICSARSGQIAQARGEPEARDARRAVATRSLRVDHRVELAERRIEHRACLRACSGIP